MKGVIIYIKVHPALRDFVLFTNNGSDLLIPKRNDLIWMAIKQQLVTKAESCTIKDTDSLIRIRMFDTHKHLYMQYPKKRGERSGVSGRSEDMHLVWVDTCHRCYLSERGNNVISRMLSKQFKHHFLTFMFTYLTANPKIEQKKVMLFYCEKFNISDSKITEEMLMKSWNRSQEKILCKKEILYTPIIF